MDVVENDHVRPLAGSIHNDATDRVEQTKLRVFGVDIVRSRPRLSDSCRRGKHRRSGGVRRTANEESLQLDATILENLDPWPIGRCPSLLPATTMGDTTTSSASGQREFVHQAGLADPGFTGNQP